MAKRGISGEEIGSLENLAERAYSFRNSGRLFNELYNKGLSKVAGSGSIKWEPRGFGFAKRKISGVYSGTSPENGKSIRISYRLSTDKINGKSEIDFDFEGGIYVHMLKEVNFLDSRRYLKNSRDTYYSEGLVIKSPRLRFLGEIEKFGKPERMTVFLPEGKDEIEYRE